MEFEDSDDYFDNTMDMIDNIDTITFEVGNEGVYFSLRELYNMDDDLIYNVGRQDGLTYVGNLIDHIYSDGYTGH